ANRPFEGERPAPHRPLLGDLVPTLRRGDPGPLEVLGSVPRAIGHRPFRRLGEQGLEDDRGVQRQEPQSPADLPGPKRDDGRAVWHDPVSRDLHREQGRTGPVPDPGRSRVVERRDQTADRPAAPVVRFLRDRPITRLIITWAAWSVTVLVVAEAGKGIGGQGRDPWEHTPIPRPVPPLARWDSGWYYWIVTHGYSYDPSIKQTPVGFYPLYPLLVRTVVGVTHTPVFWTGIALSLACFLGALALIRDLTRSWAPNQNPDDTIYAILFFPTAFFFAAFYSESLFLLTTAAALWGARRKHWVIAAVAGAAAGLTRFNGMLILLPLALYALAEAGWKLRNLRLTHFSALFSVVAGAAADPAYLLYPWGS